MASEHTVSLICDCQHAGKESAAAHGCLTRFPAEPIEGTVGTLRETAAKRGWQVMAGKHGSDVCPPCRIAAIRAASTDE